ncbi:MAG: ibpA [Bacteroidetes bacterium]|nr:ibpA [Bacteroidota bacterium]
MYMKKLDQLYSEWKGLQPIKPEYQKKIDDKFKLEFNYNSNHIEGNTLTYGQTKLLLLFGETTGNAALRDYEEMKAHNVGLEMIKQYAKDKERGLNEGFIRELNKTILVQNYWKDAQTPSGEHTRIEIKVGEYKTRPNSVITSTGEIFEYASVEETPSLMSDLVCWYNEEEKKGELLPIELAALLHYKYIRIHPFEDGNGRIARLLVNYILYKYDYPMIIIKSEDKENYLRVLHICDVNVGSYPSDSANAKLEDIEPFVDYLKNQMIDSLEISIKAAKGEDIEEKDDWKKRIKLKLQEAPVRTDELVEKINIEQVIPTFEKIDECLKEFEYIFEKNYILLRRGAYFSEIKQYAELEKIKNIISFELQKIYSTSNNKFILSLSSLLEINNYLIGIEIGGSDYIISKKYNETISEEDVNQLISFVGKHFEDFVTENIIIKE